MLQFKTFFLNYIINKVCYNVCLGFTILITFVVYTNSTIFFSDENTNKILEDVTNGLELESLYTGLEPLDEFRNYIDTEFPMFFQKAGSCQMEGIIALYNYIMAYLVIILFMVTAAWAYIIYTHIDG